VSIPVDYMDSVVTALRARGMTLDELMPLTAEECAQMETHYLVGFTAQECALLLCGELVTLNVPALDVHGKALAKTRARMESES
jgi:hypothetical protein